MANICPICNNKLRQYDKDFYVCEVCETYFDKNENIVLTEQEWLQTATTEQLAEFLTKFILDDKRFRMTMVGGVEETKMWLKQPHEQKGD